MKKILALALALSLLSGCSLFSTKPIEIKAEPVKRIPLVVPKVDPFTRRIVSWIIVTPQNAQAVFEDLKKKGEPVVLFALTTKGYVGLSSDVGAEIKITRQMQAIIDAYKKYYVDQGEEIDKTNKKNESLNSTQTP